MQTRFPMLQLIDRVRGAGHVPFGDDPDAEELEHYADEMVYAYCGDTVWLTGNVAEAPLSVICAALERQRLKGTIRVFATAPQDLPITPTTPAA